MTAVPVACLPADERASFTTSDIVDEALIEALADLGVAEQAIAQLGGATVLRGLLAEARRSLECVRLCLQVDVSCRVQCDGMYQRWPEAP